MDARSCTAEKQPASTTGSPHFGGFARPGRGTLNRMLRRLSSNCSSLRYWWPAANSVASLPMPTWPSSDGLPSVAASGMFSVLIPFPLVVPIPCWRNAASCAAEKSPCLNAGLKAPCTMLCTR